MTVKNTFDTNSNDINSQLNPLISMLNRMRAASKIRGVDLQEGRFFKKPSQKNKERALAKRRLIKYGKHYKK